MYTNTENIKASYIIPTINSFLPRTRVDTIDVIGNQTKSDTPRVKL